MTDLPTLWPRLLAAGVRWRAGMRETEEGVAAGDGWLCIDPEKRLWVDGDRLSWLGFDSQGRLLPDLDFHGTRSGLLEELRRLTGDESVCAQNCIVSANTSDRWWVWLPTEKWVHGPTEGEALIRALAEVVLS